LYGVSSPAGALDDCGISGNMLNAFDASAQLLKRCGGMPGAEMVIAPPLSSTA
jgi:hypothetical protein